jgi:hypothetical protein
VHETVAHVLHAGKYILETLARRSERIADTRIDPEVCESNLLKLLCGEELAQGEDELSGVDLASTEPADVVVVGTHAVDR